jgi:hypothetical protein
MFDGHGFSSVPFRAIKNGATKRIFPFHCASLSGHFSLTVVA